MRAMFDQKNVSHLIEEMQNALPLPGRRVFGVLKKLEKEALKLEDSALLGFVYYYYVNAHVSRNEQTKAHKYIRLAVNHLMRSGDAELLARTFNLFALDAQYSGCYDIAQNYYQMAYTLVQKNEDSLVRAIVDSNIGNLHSAIRDYAESSRHIRKSLPVVRRHSDDVLSDQNLAVAYLNIGSNSLYLGKIGEAGRSLRRAEKILSHTNIEETIYLTLLLLRAHYAYATKQREECLRNVERISEHIRNSTLYNDFVCDLVNFCRRILQEDDENIISSLILAIDRSNLAGVSCYHRLLLSELAVEHYARTGDDANLEKGFSLQHENSLAQWAAQKKMYLYSAELMLLISDLKEEQTRIRRENEKLRHQAETDALTGIPNRHAMNLELEKASARMTQAGSPLGICMFDIDSFKKYNDLYGHAPGDQCLCLVASALQHVAKEYGLFAARYGGDEFVLILEDRSNEEVEKITEAIHARMPVRVSHGTVNVVPDENTHLFDLLARADEAMYREKRGHR